MATVTLWLLVLAGVLVGALLGGAIALFVLRRGAPGSGSLRHEFDDYRRDVAEHYAETARRVDALTHAYKAVYDHLEDGAYRLVGESELRQRLEDASHEPVTIEGIGQRVLQRPGEGAGGQGGDKGEGQDDAGSSATGTPGTGRDEAGQDETGQNAGDAATNGRAEDRPDDADRRTWAGLATTLARANPSSPQVDRARPRPDPDDGRSGGAPAFDETPSRPSPTAVLMSADVENLGARRFAPW